MNDIIICPNCKKPIPLTQALSHQIQERYKEIYKKRLAEEVGKKEEELREKLEKKIKEEIELVVKDKSEEAAELRKQNKILQEQLLETNRLLRQIKNESEQKRIELEKKLFQEEEKIKQEQRKIITEEYRFRLLEKDKQMEDMRRQIEELKRKSETVSQQLQGEVLEIELKNILEREFIYDEIKDVPKGVRGADVIQIVRNNSGRACGIIIWESKRTKTWTDSWIKKLKEDQRQVKADLAIIISQVLPPGIKNFGEKNGVWIGDFEAISGLGLALRKLLIELFSVKASVVGRHEKKEILWNYLTSIEFKQRLEAFYDAYTQIKEDLKKEQEWFRRKWAKQDKNIEQLSESILGMHGDLQGIIGKSLPEIGAIQMLPSGKDKKDRLL